MIVDLSEPITAVDGTPCGGGARYTRAQVLVTHDGDPLGRAWIEIPPAGLSAQEFRERLSSSVAVGVPADPSSLGRTRPAQDRGAPDVTVAIATRERPEMLLQCVESVLSGTVAPTRVVVVDNAPQTARTEELVRRLSLEDPRIVYVREDRAGLARAHNAALPWVETPLVAITDDDVLADRRWLERIVAAFGNDPRVACVTGMIAPRELKTAPQMWIEGNDMFGKGYCRRRFALDGHRPDDPLFPYSAGAFGSGANMAFRTAFLREHGGFDDAMGAGTYAMGGDDLAAFYDVVVSGHHLVYEPAAIVLHQHHREYAALRRQMYGYGVGLGAYLTRCVIRDPRAAWHLIRRAPSARRRAGQIVAPEPVPGLPDYARDLGRQQLKGLLMGPWRYLVSRRRTRRQPHPVAARGRVAA